MNNLMKRDIFENYKHIDENDACDIYEKLGKIVEMRLKILEGL